MLLTLTCSYISIGRGHGVSILVPRVISSYNMVGDPVATDQHRSMLKTDQKTFMRSPSSTMSPAGAMMKALADSIVPPLSRADGDRFGACEPPDVCAERMTFRPQLRAKDTAALEWYFPSRNRPVQKKYNASKTSAWSAWMRLRGSALPSASVSPDMTRESNACCCCSLFDADKCADQRKTAFSNAVWGLPGPPGPMLTDARKRGMFIANPSCCACGRKRWMLPLLSASFNFRDN
jgi:hypothetical protein